MPVCLYLEKFNKLTSVCVCPVIDHEFRHNMVKVAVDPRGDSRVDPQTTFIDNVMMKFIVYNRTVYNRTDALKTVVHLFFTITLKLSASAHCRIALIINHVSVHLLTIKISQ